MTLDRYRPDFPWADRPEAVDRLRSLYGAGYSYGQCAAKIQTEFGGVVTRSAVGGKIMREGLQGTRTPKPRPKPPTPMRTERTAYRPPPTQRMVVQRGKNNTYSDPVELVDMPEITDLPPDESEFACTIVDLEFGMCRFPIGTPQDLATFRYCGAASVGPWCQRHRRVVYKPLGVRRTG